MDNQEKPTMPADVETRARSGELSVVIYDQLPSLLAIIRAQRAAMADMRTKRQSAIDCVTRAIAAEGDANKAYYEVCRERDVLRDRLANLEKAARDATDHLEGCTISNPNGATLVMYMLGELRELVKGSDNGTT